MSRAIRAVQRGGAGPGRSDNGGRLRQIGPSSFLSSAALAEKLRSLRAHGIAGLKYYHARVGMNSRLDELQAAVLRVKLRYLDAWTQARQERAARYDELFLEAGLAKEKTYPDAQQPVVLPVRAAKRTHVFNQYVIRAHERDRLRPFLAEEGIGTEVYYPLALHLQECFADWGGRAGEFPEAERATREVLVLPLYPELTDEQQRTVVDAIVRFYSR